MVYLYLKAIKRECELLRSVVLSNKKIHERIQTRFKRGLSHHQTSNWKIVCDMVLRNKPLELNEDQSIVFYQERKKMSVILIGMLSIAIIYCLPFAAAFIFCFIIGVISKALESVSTRFKNKKTLPVNPRSEAGKVILNRIERTEDYKLH